MNGVRVWIHLVFSTKKKRTIFKLQSIKRKSFSAQKRKSNSKNFRFDSINGDQEQLRCLISLNKDQSLSKTAQLIKGKSSFWINQNHLIKINSSGKMIIGQ